MQENLLKEFQKSDYSQSFRKLIFNALRVLKKQPNISPIKKRTKTSLAGKQSQPRKQRLPSICKPRTSASSAGQTKYPKKMRLESESTGIQSYFRQQIKIQVQSQENKDRNRQLHFCQGVIPLNDRKTTRSNQDNFIQSKRSLQRVRNLRQLPYTRKGTSFSQQYEVENEVNNKETWKLIPWITKNDQFQV